MSALGQKQTFCDAGAMSALPRKRTFTGTGEIYAKCHRLPYPPQLTAALFDYFICEQYKRMEDFRALTKSAILAGACG
jgi:hypothetical protein